MHKSMEENTNSEIKNDDFSIDEIKNRPPESKIRCFLYNIFYPSDMALHYLFNRQVQYKDVNETKFYEIIKNKKLKIPFPESFNEEWLTQFVDVTLKLYKPESTNKQLKTIYYHFFDLIASKKSSELIENLRIFLQVSQNKEIPIIEFIHCRIISFIILLGMNIDFDPQEIHNISEFDTMNLHDILEKHNKKILEYSSIHLVEFCLIYCIPSAVILDNRYFECKKRIPNFIQVIPEPEFIFYNAKYFNDDVFEFCTFLLQALHGYLEKEIQTFDEAESSNDNFNVINDDSDDKVYVNNPQLKIKSLLNLFLNESVVTGSFLRVILAFDDENSVMDKIAKILSKCPKIRLSAILRCQHLLSFTALYSKYRETVFNPSNGSFFENIPESFSRFSSYNALAPYWSPPESIIKIFDSDNESLLIPNSIAMINRCRFEPSNFFSEISEIQIIQISGMMNKIFDDLVLCDNFSSKQAEEMMFMCIANFFQICRKNVDFLRQNKYLHHISIVATFKSLQFIYKTPQFNIITEYGLLQRHAYRIACNFISENIILFKGYVSSYNNISNFYQNATIIKSLSPNFQSVIIYFHIFLRATSHQQFWLGLKFIKSLKYTMEDIEELEELVFSLEEPILTKNAMLYMTELILEKEGFAKALSETDYFSDFTKQILKSFKKDEYGEASLFLLYSLFKKDLIDPKSKLRYQTLQFFFENIPTLSEEIFQTLCDTTVLICSCYNLVAFPFKFKGKDFLSRPNSPSKNSLFLFMMYNYKEVFGKNVKEFINKDLEDPPKQIKKSFSFMNLLNKRYRILVKPVLLKSTELVNDGNIFQVACKKGTDPSFSGSTDNE